MYPTGYKISFTDLNGNRHTVSSKAPNRMAAVTAVHRIYGHLVASSDYTVSR